MNRCTKIERKYEEISGTFHSMRMARNGFFIGKIAAKTGLITIVGEAAERDFEVGRDYRLSGHFDNHPNYGRQFRFDSFTEPEPTSAAAMVKYLQQCEGIGTVRAEKLVARYGDETLEEIRTNPEKVAEESGMKPEVLIKASELLNSRKRLEAATLEHRR